MSSVNVLPPVPPHPTPSSSHTSSLPPPLPPPSAPSSASSSLPPPSSLPHSSSLPPLPLPLSLANSVDIFGGLSVSGTFLKSSSFDAISQFLKSSQADYSFDMNMSSLSPLLSSVSGSLSKDVADEISLYLRDKNAEDASSSSFRSPLLSSINMLRRSSGIDKNPLDTLPMPAMPDPPFLPPHPLSNTPPTAKKLTSFSLDPPAPPSTSTSKTVEEDISKPSAGVDGLTQSLKRRLSIQMEEPPRVPGSKKKRQEKNREAAQLFRQRQKAKVHELEQKMDALLSINNEYRMNIEALFSENKMLSEQLIYWKNVVASGVLISRMPGITSPDSGETRQTFVEEFKKAAESIPPTPTHTPLPPAPSTPNQ